MSLISIIVPVYNTEPYLSRCIDSILCQSFIDFELLLIDDGSSDGSGKICDAYAEKESRIRVFHKENGGVSSARNLGLEMARGEWVCFVDSDDELLPNGLQVMADGISNEVSMVLAGYIIYNDEGLLTYSVMENKRCILDRKQAIKEMFLPSDYKYQGYICGKLLLKSEVIRHELHFSKEIFFNEDRLFLTQYICALEGNVFYTTVPVYKYYERSGSAMMSLKKGFNPKFITDMVAQIKMRECVRSKYDNVELLELADFAVYKSYRRIIGLMDEFHYGNKKLKTQLRSKLVCAIGIKLYFKYEIMRNKRRVLKKIKIFK